ncbi:DUF2334 domain-containing protein [Paucibacter soli]|uniref:DUF2334 domain-containing protein n=1 Tax=Paucibacter soli TaxID=3133433 RepID=UPI0030963E97
MLTKIAGALLALLTLLSCMPASAIDDRKVSVIFRYDDYSAQDPDGLDEKVLQAFRRRHIPVTIGVIPCLVDGDMHDIAERPCTELSAARAAPLRKGQADGLVDVGLHGWRHQRHDEHAAASEFAGMPYEEQSKRIMQGRRLLEGLMGRPIDLFIPPWNSYDRTTLKVLADQGFQLISGSRLGESDPSLPLKYVPMTVKGLANVKTAVQALSQSAEEQAIMVVMFHLYDFKERRRRTGELTLAEFEAMLDWLQARKDVELLTISQLADRDIELGSTRLARARVDQLAGRLLPDQLRPDAAPYSYPERASFVIGPVAALGYYVLQLAVISMLAFACTNRLQRVFRLGIRHMVPICLASFGLFALLMHKDSSMGFRTELMAPAALGLSTGLMFALWRQHRQRASVQAMPLTERLPTGWTSKRHQMGFDGTRPGDL